MDLRDIAQAVESIVMVADQPVPPSLLAQLLEVPRQEVEAACASLIEAYERDGRGFVLARVAGGYRYQSHPDQAPYVERFVLEGQSSRLSTAALETLAIVAYKQPISRMQIAAIRGVNVDGVLRTLQQRGYVDETGRDPGPGNAVLFGTTDLFLERLGLDSLAALPPIVDFIPGADVVEALEQGLRADPTDDVAEIAPVEGDGGGGAGGPIEGGVGGDAAAAVEGGIVEPDGAAAATVETDGAAAVEADPDPEAQRDAALDGDAGADSDTAADADPVLLPETVEAPDPDRQVGGTAEIAPGPAAGAGDTMIVIDLTSDSPAGDRAMIAVGPEIIVRHEEVGSREPFRGGGGAPIPPSGPLKRAVAWVRTRLSTGRQRMRRLTRRG